MVSPDVRRHQLFLAKMVSLRSPIRTRKERMVEERAERVCRRAAPPASPPTWQPAPRGLQLLLFDELAHSYQNCAPAQPINNPWVIRARHLVEPHQPHPR